MDQSFDLSIHPITERERVTISIRSYHKIELLFLFVPIHKIDQTFVTSSIKYFFI